jgi:hypothetical protein
MAAEIFELKPPGNEGIEEMLEHLLEQVRDGNVSSMAVAWVTRDGRVANTWSEAPNFGAMLGSVNRLAHHLNLQHDDENAASG